jgi:hypothetical protein
MSNASARDSRVDTLAHVPKVRANIDAERHRQHARPDARVGDGGACLRARRVGTDPPTGRARGDGDRSPRAPRSRRCRPPVWERSGPRGPGWGLDPDSRKVTPG